MKRCSIVGCPKLLDIKGLCHGHYERKRLKRKMSMDTPLRGWNSLGIKASNVKEYGRQWRKLRNYKSVGAMHKMKFGGLREWVIKRDQEKCQLCGITREEHKLEFGKDITVNHIDHQSFCSSTFDGFVNNDTDNLETLCVRCHGAKDAIKHGKYSKYLVNLPRVR